MQSGGVLACSTAVCGVHGAWRPLRPLLEPCPPAERHRDPWLQLEQTSHLPGSHGLPSAVRDGHCACGEGWQAQPSSRPSRPLLGRGAPPTMLVGSSARRAHRRGCPRLGPRRAGGGGGRASGRGGGLLEKLSQTRRFRHRQLGRDLRLLTRAPLCDPSTPVWALCVTWASPRHGDFLTAWGLLVGQTSYTGLRASGVSVPANGAEAAPPTFMSQPWTRTPSLLPSQGSSRVTGQPRFHRCRGRSRPEQQTQKRPLPSSALPHASPVVMLMGTRGLDVLR